MLRITTRIQRVRGVSMLAPVYKRDREELEAISGKAVMHTAVLKYTGLDSIRNWYWAIVQTVADGCGVSKQFLHIKLKEETEFYGDVFPGERGPLYSWKSISNASDITPAEMREYVRAAIEIIHIRWLPGIAREDVYRRVEELEGVPRPKF